MTATSSDNNIQNSYTASMRDWKRGLLEEWKRRGIIKDERHDEIYILYLKKWKNLYTYI